MSHAVPPAEGAPDRAAPEISVVTAVDDELVAAFARLIPQLSSSSPAPDAAWLGRIVASPDVVLFVARDGEPDATGRRPIVGSLTLAFYPMPTRLKAWIEDVVVDADVRGRRIGELLTVAGLDEARRRGASSVDLTSRPSRTAAHRLYERCGFVIRDTAVYRYAFGPVD